MIAPHDRCLIVEDNFVILLDLEDMVKSMGFKSIDQASSLAQTMELLEKTRYRVVLLDLQLGSESSVPIVKILKNQKIPFAITTGYCVDDDRPSLLHGVPVIPKPYSVGTVNRILGDLLNPAQSASQPSGTPLQQ